jgi:hypothetical protein
MELKLHLDHTHMIRTNMKRSKVSDENEQHYQIHFMPRFFFACPVII